MITVSRIKRASGALALALLVASCAESPKEPSLADAEKAFTSGNYTETITISRSLVTSGKDVPEAHFMLARVLIRQGNADAAIDAIEDALRSGLANPSERVVGADFSYLGQNPRYLMILERYGLSMDSMSIGTGKTRIRAGDIEIELD